MVPGQSWNWQVHNGGCGVYTIWKYASLPHFTLHTCVNSIQHGDSAIIAKNSGVYLY